jgi:signal peptidase II
MIIGLIISAIAVIVLVAADLLIKSWVVTSLAPIGSMDLIKFGKFDIVGLHYTENTGAAFSIFKNSTLFLTILVSVLVVGLCIYGIMDKDKRPFKSVCLIMIISGGIGNLIDRIRNGYVVDYIELRFMNFAIFNFADILATCGCIMLLIYVITSESRRKHYVSDYKHRSRIHEEIAHITGKDNDR